jgi:homoserine O-acetyltransferase
MSALATLPCTSGVTALPPLSLQHGGQVTRGRLAWRSYGDTALPAILVLGGISAHRHVAYSESDAQAGWWQDLAGPGHAVDTTQFRVLGTDWLGGSGDSTNAGELPHAHGDIPAITPADQARAIVALLDALGIASLHACIGASYGGMVALAQGALFPRRVKQLLVMGAAHQPHPMATGLRSLQRSIVRLGVERGAGREALCIARGLGVTTYRSPREFAQRFRATPLCDAGRFRFEVQDYLAHQGETFADRFSPESFLCLSQSIDLHDIDPAAVRVPTALVAFDPDAIAPVWQVRELAQRLGERCSLDVITTLYGHDAFLKEVTAVSRIVSRVLEVA